MATQAEVARHLFVDPAVVSRHVADGIFVKQGRGGLDLDDCRERYIVRLREQAAGRASASGDYDLVAERARLTAEQADGAAMRNRQLRGELLDRAHVQRIGEAFVANCRARILAIPSRAAPRLLAMKSATAIEDMLRRLVNEALAELAGIRGIANDLPEPGDGGDDRQLGDGVDAAPDVDSQRVGGRAKVSQRRG